VVKRHPDGFGFLIPENKSNSDVYLSKKQMLGVMNNDLIKVSVKRQRKGFLSGKVIQMIQRSKTHIIGKYQSLSDKTGIIKDDSSQWGDDLIIKLKHQQQLKDGQWIKAKVIHWPDSRFGFVGELTNSLGFFPQALEDNIRTIQTYNIPTDFSIECLRATKAIPEKLIKDPLRKDLRNLPFITIDGEDAQDFDDAIYVSPHQKGWKLYVAIADVSFYVKKDSILDKEAALRGNSTYLPGFTLPMLPKKLSNHLCSLNPKKDRLAFIVEMDFTNTGDNKKAYFYEATIQSHARLNYGVAQDIIDQTKIKKNISPVFTNVINAAKLAKILLKKRIQKHFIQLEIPETEVKLDALGHPTDITKTHRLFSHQLIEELMLATNKSVAEYLKKIPTIYRVHDAPKRESLKLLEVFAKAKGVNISLADTKNLHQKISLLRKKIPTGPLSDILQSLILSSLSQAIYSPHQKKHFGLNTEYYTHFTSPIRRYSDLLVHRILKSVLKKKPLPYTINELASLSSFISSCEQRSVKAERKLKDIKRARFIKQHIGQQMEGVISGVTSFGFFVRLKFYDIEGLVHIKHLKGRWVFEKSLLELRSNNSNKVFKIGEPVFINVKSSNIDTGQIDFILSSSF